MLTLRDFVKTEVGESNVVCVTEKSDSFAFGEKGLKAIVDIDVSLKQQPLLRTVACFSFHSRAPEPWPQTAMGYFGPKDVDPHSILNNVSIIIIVVSEEVEIPSGPHAPQSKRRSVVCWQSQLLALS